MKKRLMVGLLSAGLVVAMLPGVTVAKDDGKSDCKKGGWTEFVREDQTAFADQDECVAYVAKGGTLTDPAPTTTFESACASEGGQYGTDIVWKDEYIVSEACSWSGIDHYTISAHFEAVAPYCTGQIGTYDDADPLGDGWFLCDWD